MELPVTEPLQPIGASCRKTAKRVKSSKPPHSCRLAMPYTIACSTKIYADIPEICNELVQIKRLASPFYKLGSVRFMSSLSVEDETDLQLAVPSDRF